jgi:hypothetical protein
MVVMSTSHIAVVLVITRTGYLLVINEYVNHADMMKNNQRFKDSKRLKMQSLKKRFMWGRWKGLTNMVFRKGCPSGYLNPEDSVTVKPKWICECQPNVIFKSIDGLCARCGAFCLTAEAYMEKEQANLSPKVKKPTKVYDDVGRLVSDSKGKPKNKPVKIEMDFENDRKAKAKKR